MPKEILTELYKKMLLIRRFERKCNEPFLQGLWPDTFLQYVEQEAVAAGVIVNLRKDDYVLTTYRGNAHFVAGGASIDKLVARTPTKEDRHLQGQSRYATYRSITIALTGRKLLLKKVLQTCCQPHVLPAAEHGISAPKQDDTRTRPMGVPHNLASASKPKAISVHWMRSESWLVGLPLDLVVVGYLSQEKIVNFKGEVSEALGGPAAYVSLAGAKLGAQVGIVSKVGADFKPSYRRMLTDGGVDARGIIVSGERTTIFRNAYDQSERRTQTILARSPAITVSDLPSDYMASKCFHFGPIFHEVEHSLVQTVHEKGSITSLDPQGYLRKIDEEGRVTPSTWRDAHYVMPFVDIYRSDSNEAHLITGENDPMRAAEKISEMGPKIVLVTMERKGSILLNEGHVTKIPLILADRFVDSTGAGDVYMAGFIVEYLATRDPVGSALFGSCAASFKVEGIGVSNLPTRAAVKKRLGALKGND